MNAPQPFACRYTPEVPKLLDQLGATIALSTYQAGKLIFLSARDATALVQLPRNFAKAMGVAEDPATDRLAVACIDRVEVFRNSAALAAHHPKTPGKYDALYMPRATFYTGPLDLHDLHFGADDTLYAVNTRFSCIVEVDDRASFTPVWRPPFVDAIAGDDRCHLNGMAMEAGRPRFVTAFNQGNSAGSWRANITETGIVMDVTTNEVVAEGLAMPHSPTLIGGELYLCESATGNVLRIDRATGAKEVVVSLGSFVRGLSAVGDCLFVGMSRMREGSRTFGQIAANLPHNRAGIMVIHLPTRSKLGLIEYTNSVEEIYDVHILQGKRRPNVLTTADALHRDGVTTPDTTFWRKPDTTEST